MGAFDESRKAVAEGLYEAAKPYLRKHNGLTHVIFFYLTGEFGGSHYGCDQKMTLQLNQYIVGMQKDDYEILDIKLEVLPEKSALMNQQRYVAMVTYK